MPKEIGDKRTDLVNDMPIRPGGFGNGRAMGRPPAKAKDIKGTLIRLWKYMTHQKVKLLLVLFMILASSVLTLVGPYLIGVAIDVYILPQDFRGLAFISLVMFLVFVFASISTWLQEYLMIIVSQKTVAHIRRDLFAKIQVLPLRYFDSKPHGELMSRLTNDVENISSTLSSSTTQVIVSIITLVGTVGVMLWLSPILTLVSLIVMPLMGMTTKFITKHTRKYFAEQQKSLGELNGLIEESISGQKVIKAFARESQVLEDFEEYNQRLRAFSIKAQLFSGLIYPMMNVLNNISFAIVAGVGGWLTVKEYITVGVIAIFISYTRQFTRPLNDLANQFNMVLSAIAGAERVFEVMDEETEPVDSEDAIVLEEIKGYVEFEDVSFSYVKGTPILKDINLLVQPGKMIALVGPTGAGKTTIINLLTRFYDIDKGSIKIDQKNIQQIKREDLRSALGIVLQDTYLFSESIRENIRYGRLSATNEEVEEAARLANADHFIQRLPYGYETTLGEDGGDLSQGQKQLIAIARAFLANPSILILDEATSSIDTRTEVRIQEAMLKLMKGRTSFVIAHRLSTIQKADKIVVINHGRIVEEGNHDALLQQKGEYYKLYMSQYNNIEEVS